MALLLDSLVDVNSEARKTIRQQSLVICRKALGSVSAPLSPMFFTLKYLRKFTGTLSEVFSLCLKLAKSGSNSLRFVPLLGVACDVSSSNGAIPESVKSELLQLFTSSILMSKIPVPPHVLVCELKVMVRAQIY